MVDLETTNWILGVIALASAVQMLICIGLVIAGFKLYRQTTQTLAELDKRHVEPLRREVDGILANLQAITARISHQTERVDEAITGTIERVDETAERVKYSVRDKVNRAAGIVRGVRAIIASLLVSEPKRESPAEAGGRAY
jgi:uncharacterized protein YoxC